jgi:hypothetical protein
MESSTVSLQDLYLITLTIEDTQKVLYYNLDGKQVERDNQKKLVSEAAGITLIVIPYWWRHSEQFLQSCIAVKRPDIYPYSKYRVLPNIFQPKISSVKSAYSPAKDQPFDIEKMDPFAWYEMNTAKRS